MGGASSTETPFGPDFKITTLSYVMSLMPPQVLEDLQLAKHGYQVHPMGPGYIPFPDGRSLTHYDDVARSQEEYAKFSKADAEALPRWEAWMEGVAAVLGPLLMTTPPEARLAPTEGPARAAPARVGDARARRAWRR